MNWNQLTQEDAIVEAKLLGGVYHLAKKYGVAFETARRKTGYIRLCGIADEDKTDVLAMAGKVPIPQIAERTGYTYGQIVHFFRSKGRGLGLRCGPKSKLTNEQQEGMVELVAKYGNQEKTAEALGVSVKTISKYVVRCKKRDGRHGN